MTSEFLKTNILEKLHPWKFEILLALFAIIRIIYGVLTQPTLNLFYDGYLEHATIIRDRLVHGFWPLGNFESTGPRQRLLYPFVCAIFGLFISDMHISCALVNFLSQSVALFLLYFLIFNISKQKDVAFVSTVIFGLLGGNLYFIWAGMTDSMGIMLMIATIICLMRYYTEVSVKNFGLVVLFMILTILTRENLAYIVIAPLMISLIALFEDWRNKNISMDKTELINSLAMIFIPFTVCFLIWLFTGTIENIIWWANNLIVWLNQQSVYNREIRTLIIIIIAIIGPGLVGLIPGIQEMLKEKKSRIFLILPILGVIPILISSGAFMHRFFLPFWFIVIFIEILGLKILLVEKNNSSKQFWFVSCFLILYTGFLYFQWWQIFSLELPSIF